MVEKLALSTSGFHLDRLGDRCHTGPDFPFRVCQDFWFSDGNVILSAGPFAFKVHRGQLERHAEFFQTMLSIPQPENADSIINLCDSPTDVYHLLRALYDGLYEKQQLDSSLWVIFWTDYRCGCRHPTGHFQVLPPAVRARFPVPRLGPPPILQILHLRPTETMPGASADLLPDDARGLGPPRTHVARAQWPLRRAA
jgi:hypothetical protein